MNKSEVKYGDSSCLYDMVMNFNAPFIINDALANKELINKVKSIKSNFGTCTNEQLEKSFFDENLNLKNVDFLPLSRLNSSDEKKSIRDAFNIVLDIGQYTSGEYVSKFESYISSFLRIKHVIGTSSGTAGLMIALKSLGVKCGDEVIIPSNSFAATENAVLACGAIPILADINSDDYTIDPIDIEKKITNKTKVILPVHLYGKLANMKKIKEIADLHKLKIVEDACQAIGVTGVGLYSDLSVLSFNPFKNFGVCGKSGAILTNNDELEKMCRIVGYHGFDVGKKNFKTLDFGYNCRMDNIMASIGVAKLPFLSLNNFKRCYLAKRYIENLKDLQECGKIILPEFTSDNSWHLFPIRVTGDRQEIMSMMKKKGIETQVYYPVLTHEQNTSLKSTCFKGVRLPISEIVNQTILNIPLHHALTIQEQNLVLEAIRDVIK